MQWLFGWVLFCQCQPHSVVSRCLHCGVGGVAAFEPAGDAGLCSLGMGPWCVIVAILDGSGQVAFWLDTGRGWPQGIGGVGFLGGIGIMCIDIATPKAARAHQLGGCIAQVQRH